MSKVSLYRHFDDDGRLLYVGISKNAVARIGGHKSKSWYEQIANVRIEHHDSREHAMYAEAVAIRDEKPMHNIMKPIPVDPDAPQVAPAPFPEKSYTEADFRKFLKKAQEKCDEPIRDVQGRRMAYVRCPREDVISWIRVFRGAGVPDGLMFFDVPEFFGDDLPNWVRVLKSSQHEGVTILCSDIIHFEDAIDILQARGVILEQINHNMLSVEQNAANVRKSRAGKSK